MSYLFKSYQFLTLDLSDLPHPILLRCRRSLLLKWGQHRSSSGLRVRGRLKRPFVR